MQIDLKTVEQIEEWIKKIKVASNSPESIEIDLYHLSKLAFMRYTDGNLEPRYSDAYSYKGPQGYYAAMMRVAYDAIKHMVKHDLRPVENVVFPDRTHPSKTHPWIHKYALSISRGELTPPAVAVALTQMIAVIERVCDSTEIGLWGLMQQHHDAITNPRKENTDEEG